MTDDVRGGSAPTIEPPTRDPDLVLARVHLRLGSVSLARTELETMAGRGSLDDDGLRDLAEARWRTGDLGGAGDAASAWLEVRPDDVLGLVIAAEAQAAAGRPGEARKLAGRAIERAEGSLDPIFAGMPRASIWPVEPGSETGPAGVLFDELHPSPHALPPLAGADEPADAQPDATAPTAPAPAAAFDGPSLWGDDGPGAEPSSANPADLVRTARAALDAGRVDDAAAALLLALRAAPSLAPAVLDLLAPRSEPILAVIRGDAARIVGHEVDAMRDHASAATSLQDRTATADADAEGDADGGAEASHGADADADADPGEVGEADDPSQDDIPAGDGSGLPDDPDQETP
jgi:hypothetical protein